MPEQTPTDLVPAEQRAELRARLSYATPADAETAYRCMGAPLLANDPAMFLRLLDLEDEVGQLRSETTPKGTGVVYTAGVVDIDSLAIPDLTEQERAAFLAGPESTAYDLWNQAGGDTDEYRRLLTAHGLIRPGPRKATTPETVAAVALEEE